MRVEILTSVASATFSYGPGVFNVGDKPGEMPERDAFQLLRDGIAKLVKSDDIETATLPAPEVAVTRGRSRRGSSGNRSKPDKG